MGLGVGLVTLWAALSATDRPLAVLVTSERSGSAPYSAAIAKSVSQELERARAGVLLPESESVPRLQSAGSPKPKSCNGSRPCLLKLAEGLGAEAVLIAVDVGKLGSKLVIHVEGISAQGESLAVLDFSTAVSSYTIDAAGPIVLFADSLAQKLRAQAETKAQPSATPVPPPPVEPPPQVTVPEPRRSVVAPVTLLGLGVVGVGVGVGFVVDALGAKSSIDRSYFTGPDGRTASHLTQTQLDSLTSRGNTGFTVALISGVVGAALLAVGFWLFLSN